MSKYEEALKNLSCDVGNLCKEMGWEMDNKDIEVMKELIKEKSDLEEKLAESEKRIKDLEFRNKNLEHSLKVAPNANAGQRARIVELREINHKLKQQLAEKENEIKSLRTRQFIDMTEKEMLELKIATHNEDLKKIKHIFNQDKISFALEQLEKVKELLFEKAIEITGASVDGVRLYSINEIFSNQIKQLKEMK